MKATFTLLCVYFYALLSSGNTSDDDDRRWLSSLIALVEMDYEDHCDQRATASWNELVGSPKGLAQKLGRDKSYGIFARAQTTDIRIALKAHALSDDELLKRKVKLLLQPGDLLLTTEQWIRLVTFADTSENALRFATDYDCGTTINCTLRELHNSLAKQHDEDTLRHMKESWEKKLPDLNEYLETILPLLKNTSKENEFNTVEEYWDSLAEYEGATLKARELWDRIRPLYEKLHKYVALRLKGTEAVGKPLPVYLLRSLAGDDWSNVIENLLPKHADIYQKLYANLQLKNLGGVNAFKEATKLLTEINMPHIEPYTWDKSIFNSSCPPVLVDWCKPNKLRVISCSDVSIGNYMDAHEAVMRIKYKDTVALHSNNTYTLRNANRYSAVYEAIPEFASLLSVNPHALSRAGLYSIERFNYNPNYHRLVLQLITALRDLPKLNFYIAADEWRLKYLKETKTSSTQNESWSDFRRNFSWLETSDVDILGNPYVLHNKPFIGKFMGLILKYQIYQSFAEELISDESDLIKHISENNDRLVSTMSQGLGIKWPEMVSDLLAKRENVLEYTGLTDYYRLLDEYLDNQLDPQLGVNESDDYVEPSEPETIENEIPTEFQLPRNSETHENIQENEIDTGYENNMKFGTETSTVGVLEIKNPVVSGDQEQKDTNVKEASYNVYWWIGIAVAVAIIVILIAIIARKRQNHRKQLDRQRRENTHA
ncbi:angiotensin-converting enzyme-like protein Ace3 [Cydia fagiglandana]|uniref:angiotensin-converting enzyme-like protein Ace3 n=1 Tax=Cydia fagiglandana TaxID=1458189 RepID=UPI002FEE0048